MLEYDKIDVSEWIDVNKTSASKEYDICHFWHDLMQKAMSFNDVAIVYVKRSACRIHFWYMSIDDAVSIISNSNLVDKKGVLHFFYHI